MKCEFCEKEFTPTEADQTICEDCINSVDELTDGKGDDNE